MYARQTAVYHYKNVQESHSLRINRKIELFSRILEGYIQQEGLSVNLC